MTRKRHHLSMGESGEDNDLLSLCHKICTEYASLVGRVDRLDRDHQRLLNALLLSRGDRARLGLEPGRPLPSPGTPRPTDQEAQDLFQAMRLPIYGRTTAADGEVILGYEPMSPGAFARQAVENWGRPALRLTPVAEGGPQPIDLDGKNRCWWYAPGSGEYVPSYRLCEDPKDPRFTHWAPYYSFPAPDEEDGGP